MKLKNIFLILFLCCTSLCFAQDKLFEKYADMDNVTSVFISKKMFDMIPNVESGGPQPDESERENKQSSNRHFRQARKSGTRCEKNSAALSANHMKN